MIVYHVQDIRLHQEHEVIFTLLDSTNCLWEAEAAFVPNIIRPKVDTRGAGQPAPQQRQRQVKAIIAMPYRAGEAYGHYLPPGCGTLKFYLIPSIKCAVLPPIKPT